MQNIIIYKFLNCVRVYDQKGKSITFEKRFSDCFILTLRGRICFSFENDCLYADETHPVFLPCGLKYTNTCREDAESIVINFRALVSPAGPCLLTSVPEAFANDCYTKIRNSCASAKQALVFSYLYALSDKLFETTAGPGRENKIVADAEEYMKVHYADPELTVGTIAGHCFVSEIYLRKLFSKYRGIPPAKMLTKIRMNEAYLLFLDKRSVKETALRVGYSDIFQFSRAYKRFFGFSPSETRQKP